MKTPESLKPRPLTRVKIGDLGLAEVFNEPKPKSA